MTAADPAAALCVYLLAQPAVSTAAAGRVFRPDLPETEIPAMPRACVIVSPAGGYQMFGLSPLPLGDPRLDVLCYGETWLESERLASEVTVALRALRQSVWNGTRLYWARIETGPTPARDPDTNWPGTVVIAQVSHSLATVA